VTNTQVVAFNWTGTSWSQPLSQYTNVSSSGTGGTISPNGSSVVTPGSNITFTASPNFSYIINQWLLDSSVVQTGGTNYTLNNIQANHTIQVTFTHVLTFIINSPPTTLQIYQP
jgi:cytoskeletal protein RodZ